MNLDNISKQMDRISDGYERIIEKAAKLCDVLEPIVEEWNRQFDEYRRSQL